MQPPRSLLLGLPPPPSPWAPITLSLAAAAGLSLRCTVSKQRTQTRVVRALCSLPCLPCLVTTLSPGHNCLPWRLSSPLPPPPWPLEEHPAQPQVQDYLLQPCRLCPAQLRVPLTCPWCADGLVHRSGPACARGLLETFHDSGYSKF